MSRDDVQAASPSIFYLDYGAHSLVYDFPSDLNEICDSTPELRESIACCEVRSVQSAYIEGCRVAFSAVSREGPRLGMLNVVPRLEPRPYALDNAASPVQSAMKEAEEREYRLCGVNPDGRVYGVLYELPSECEPAVFEMVAREGSFNRFARLPCWVVSAESKERGTPLPGEGKAIVCAAIDMDLLEQRYVVAEALKETWQPMPPLLEWTEAKRTDRRLCGSGRWPYQHWCNCIASDRLAPAQEYLKCLREMLQESGVAKALPPPMQSIDELLCLYYGLGPKTYKAPDPGVVECDCPIRFRNVARNPAEARTFYMAYGSNLSWEQVCLRIGPPYDRRPVTLHGYELVANKVPYSEQYASFGYYNVVPCAAAHTTAEAVEERSTTTGTCRTMPPYVCGAAYEISEAQLALMDRYERGYRRALLPCEDTSSQPDERLDGLACWVYIAEHTAEALLPSKEYLQRVLEGADILPPDYVEAIRATPTNPLRSPRQDRRLRKEL